MVAPIVGEIAQTYATRLKVGKLNVDENPMIARQYGIRGIPTLMIFKDGKLADTVVGAVPKQALEQALEPHLAKS
jgi:thioredoxin 1